MIYQLFLDTKYPSTFPCNFISPSISESIDLAVPFIKTAFQYDADPDITLSYSKYESMEDFFASNCVDSVDCENEDTFKLYREESYIVYHNSIKNEALAYIDEQIKKIRKDF